MEVSKEVANSVVGWLASKKADPGVGTLKKIIVGAILAVVVLFVLAYISRKAFTKWKELADLKHKQDVLVEEKERAKVDLELEKSDAVILEKTNEIIQLDWDLEVVNSKIELLDEEYKLEKEKIDALNNWDALDKHIRITYASR